jgi:hypothetical protein
MIINVKRGEAGYFSPASLDDIERRQMFTYQRVPREDLLLRWGCRLSRFRTAVQAEQGIMIGII